MKYRKKPVVIDAVQWRGDNLNEVLSLPPSPNTPRFVDPRGDEIVISTLEGQMTANIGDYIIRGVKGELYPCKPDIFAATYEPVEEEGGAK